MLTLACIAAAASLAQSPPVTLDSLLHEMADRTAVARLPVPAYTCRQFSSYDRKSVTPDDPAGWFANGDVNQYLRVEEAPAPTADNAKATRKEWVMADMDGPGAIVRIWSANPKGNLRVYLDNSTTPVIEGPMTDWLSGKAAVPAPLSHELSKGWNLYLPIPYAKHCKITSDADGFYYQINYRTYPTVTAVESLTTGSLAAASGLIARTGGSLSVPHPKTAPARPTESIAPGSTMEKQLPPGPMAVSLVEVLLDAADLQQATRSTVLSAEFDGEQTIWCPVGDFFGSGVGVNPFADCYRAVDSAMRCIWVMPYQRTGKVTLHNLGAEPVRAKVNIQATRWTWDDRSMHFHAAWRYEYPIHTKAGAGTADWNYIEIKGRGVYLGDNLAVMNPSPIWWGEGDEKVYVDGEKFPSHFGTGTEDYYGYAWCWPEPFQNPFHAQPRCDGWKATKKPSNYGHTTVTRVRALDAIPFTSSFKFDMEAWHWRETDVAYAATTYFYARPGATTNREPDPKSAASAIPQPPPLPPPYTIAGAIECESMKIVAKSDGLPTEVQELDLSENDRWSNETQLWVKGRKIGDFVELEIPAPGAGPVSVTVHATRSWDYGVVQFYVNGKAAGGPVDFFSGRAGLVRVSGPIDLGAHAPADGMLILRAEVVGGNEKSQGSKSFFGLDCLVLK
ncbi:hypothetical protein PHYC_03467 [Phycisphaerales bacterium]|nr:hypothetical protein PHYC_03467 [Phycisphaerales bacterium]